MGRKKKMPEIGKHYSLNPGIRERKIVNRKNMNTRKSNKTHHGKKKTYLEDKSAKAH